MSIYARTRQNQHPVGMSPLRSDAWDALIDDDEKHRSRMVLAFARDGRMVAVLECVYCGNLAVSVQCFFNLKPPVVFFHRSVKAFAFQTFRLGSRF